MMRATGVSRSICAAVLLAASATTAHDSLYNYVEVNGLDPDFLRIEFTVHAGELTPEADPNSADLLWVESLTDEQVENLLQRAVDFVASTYQCSFPGKYRVRFPSCGELRDLARAPNASRPGCIVGTVTLKRDADLAIPLRYCETARKRLMFVTTKPGSFPRVKDLAPGETIEIPLQ